MIDLSLLMDPEQRQQQLLLQQQTVMLYSASRELEASEATTG